ncbi:hypothetical protein [Kaarinaea lacus]
MLEKELADKVVTAFKLELNEDALKCINDNQFEKLSLMIQEALSDEKRDIAEMVADLVRKLKADSKVPDISM